MTAVLLVLLLVLVAVNGLFVAAEFALVRTRKARMEALAKEGAANADAVLDQIERLDEYLSACQVGITMASIGIGFLGEPAVAELIEPLIDGPLGHGVATGVSVAIAFTLVTALHISIGEQVPKIVAITRAEGTARHTARPLNWFRIVSGPFTLLLTKFSNAILRLFGIRDIELEEAHSAEDLRDIIRESSRGGKLDPGEAVMLGGVFHLHEQEAREVMTPIPRWSPSTRTRTSRTPCSAASLRATRGSSRSRTTTRTAFGGSSTTTASRVST